VFKSRKKASPADAPPAGRESFSKDIPRAGQSRRRRFGSADVTAAPRIKGSIRWKLLSTLMGLIVGLVVTLTAIELVLQKQSLESELNKRIDLMRENLVERGRALSNLLLTQVENDVAAFNFSHISEVLNKAIEESPQLDYAILMNTEGVAFIHTGHPELQQEALNGDADRYALAQTQLTYREYPELNATEFVLPIHFGAKQWGVLRLGFSLEELQREIARSKADIVTQTRNMILSTGAIAGIFILIGSGIVLVISTKLSHPLIRLTASVRELARGNFDVAAQLLDESSRGKPGRFQAEGEIGLLAHSFAEMAGEIRQSHRELEEYNRTLEEKVKARTLELEQAYDKLKELDQMKTNFLSTVSHELRTPLTSVLGFARIIQKKFESTLLPTLAQSGDKKIERAVRQVMDNTHIIVEEGERLTTLINDVLDLAKMEAGRTDWNMQPLRIEDIIERAMAATSSLFANKPVRLLKDIAADLPRVEGDRDRLIQVAINLISNAVKFTEQGSVTCKAALQGDEMIVGVADTGCGIKPEDQPLVFEKFKQVGDTLTDKPKGTGLGLPICKEIVEHHGGRVWVESELGVGSTFLFSLPLPGTPDADAAVVLAPDGSEVGFVLHADYGALEQRLKAHVERQAARDPMAPRTVLIIDDDPNICQLLRQELAGEGCRVREAHSGVQGLALIEADPPDLIILDVQMPHLNGFAVAARLHADPVTLGLPIILHTVAEDKKLSERLGIDRYLTKPVNGAVLIEEVRALLAPVPERIKRILVLDGQPERRQTFAALLGQAGYEVRVTGDGETCVDEAVWFSPHLAMADAGLAAQHRIVPRLRVDQGMNRLFFALLDGSAP
jgi:signal transduction histidine kinase/DNA-binding response OmpR family regulator